MVTGQTVMAAGMAQAGIEVFKTGEAWIEASSISGGIGQSRALGMAQRPALGNQAPACRKARNFAALAMSNGKATAGGSEAFRPSFAQRRDHNTPCIPAQQAEEQSCMASTSRPQLPAAPTKAGTSKQAELTSTHEQEACLESEQCPFCGSEMAVLELVDHAPACFQVNETSATQQQQQQQEEEKEETAQQQPVDLTMVRPKPEVCRPPAPELGVEATERERCRFCGVELPLLDLIDHAPACWNTNETAAKLQEEAEDVESAVTSDEDEPEQEGIEAEKSCCPYCGEEMTLAALVEHVPACLRQNEVEASRQHEQSNHIGDESENESGVQDVDDCCLQPTRKLHRGIGGRITRRTAAAGLTQARTRKRLFENVLGNNQQHIRDARREFRLHLQMASGIWCEKVESMHDAVCRRPRIIISDVPRKGRPPCRDPSGEDFTIFDMFPYLRRNWEPWDRRRKFNCITSDIGSPSVAKAMTHALQTPGCCLDDKQKKALKEKNLIWDECYHKQTLRSLHLPEVEEIMGLPKHYTVPLFQHKRRTQAIGATFCVPTFVRLLTPFARKCHSSTDLKDGVSVLSLFDGIGAAAIILHELKVKIKTYHTSEKDHDLQKVVSKWFK
eukprot:jgi/Chlat1/110/Chrsp1S03214